MNDMVSKRGGTVFPLLFSSFISLLLSLYFYIPTFSLVLLHRTGR